MSRRVLALPLAVLVAILLLLAALTTTGGIPQTLAVPLISGVVAAMLTGGLALLGIWINIRYQIDRDRLERLRVAYSQLLRASDKVFEAMLEVTNFPNGRPFPEPGGISISPAFRPPTQLDIERAKHDPFQIESALLSQALDLRAQAEATIYLDEGDASRVLYESSRLAQCYDEWRNSVRDEKVTPDEQERLRLEVPVQLIQLRDVAHAELKRLSRR
jgi:hypothetical protein